MIEVVLIRNGRRHDSAEADTPDAALYAARTIAAEARVAEHNAFDAKWQVVFAVEGKTVRMVDAKELH